jgi:hypothetical protein
MNSPQFVVFDMNEEMQTFRNNMVDKDVKFHLVDVWQIQKDMLELVFKGCGEWDKAHQAMCANSMEIVDKYLEHPVFETRLDFYMACTDLAYRLYSKVVQHRMVTGGEFHYQFDRFTRAGLVVLSLNWDNTARAA